MGIVQLTVNGEQRTLDLAANTPLVDALREQLRLTGTHIGCDTGQCGACTVLIDGEAVKSCSLLAVQAEDRTIVTVEGLADDDGTPHPMQQAFHDHHGLQCGFCTPGMIAIGIDIARRHGTPDAATVRRELDGNLCRCTGYQNIVKAVVAGAQAMAGGR